MANTKKNVEKSEATPLEPSANISAAESKKQKTPVKLDDSLLITVQSNVAGALVYENPRTGSMIRWNRFADIQTVPMSDLRAMKAGYRRFFEDNWVIIKGVEDAGYEDVTPEEIYKALAVAQYYKVLIDPDHFDDFFRLDRNEMKRRIDLMTDGAKLNLVVAANSAIENGVLDSIRTVKMLEDLLGCELLEIK